MHQASKVLLICWWHIWGNYFAMLLHAWCLQSCMRGDKTVYIPLLTLSVDECFIGSFPDKGLASQKTSTERDKNRIEPFIPAILYTITDSIQFKHVQQSDGVFWIYML